MNRGSERVRANKQKKIISLVSLLNPSERKAPIDKPKPVIRMTINREKIINPFICPPLERNYQ